MPCLPALKALELTIDGQKHLFVAPIGDRDPMEVTLGEWMSAPAVTGAVMMDWFMKRRHDEGKE